MGRLILFTSIWLFTWVVLMVVIGFVARWGLRKTNRVDPATPTRAPVAWLWSPARPARQHRRMRASVAAMDASLLASGISPSSISTSGVSTSGVSAPASAEPSTSLSAIRANVVDQAVHADEKLVMARHLRKQQRRRALDDIESVTVQIEQLTARIIDMRTRLGQQPVLAATDVADQARALDAASRDLDLLAEAHRELVRIETRGVSDELSRLIEQSAGPSGRG